MLDAKQTEREPVQAINLLSFHLRLLMDSWISTQHSQQCEMRVTCVMKDTVFYALTHIDVALTTLL